MMRWVLFGLAVMLPSGVQAPAAAVRPADLVLHGGRIVTVDDGRPEAQAMAVNGDTITAIGSEREIQRYIGPNTRVIDLKGRLPSPASSTRTCISPA